jgi:peroxiredoxin
LPDIDGDESLVLPIPATYVIGRDGIIALAFLDVDYRNRPEPSDVLTALRALSKESKGIVMSCSKKPRGCD